jgi:uncharacterized FlaG/YvyC family protein
MDTLKLNHYGHEFEVDGEDLTKVSAVARYCILEKHVNNKTFAQIANELDRSYRGVYTIYKEAVFRLLRESYIERMQIITKETEWFIEQIPKHHAHGVQYMAEVASAIATQLR